MPDTTDVWRRVAPISKAEADQLVASRTSLGRYLSERFRQTFGAEVEDVTVERFPDGLLVTLLADVRPDVKYNVWALTIASAIADASAAVPVNVVVRGLAELRT
jgi:hypothetical protein